MPATMTKGKAKAKEPERKLFAREAALVVLHDRGRPMHYREIARVAHEQDLIRPKRTDNRVPELAKTVKTMRSYLNWQANLTDGSVVRLADGVFALGAGVKRPDTVAREILAKRISQRERRAVAAREIRAQAEGILAVTRGSHVREAAERIIALAVDIEDA